MYIKQVQKLINETFQIVILEFPHPFSLPMKLSPCLYREELFWVERSPAYAQLPCRLSQLFIHFLAKLGKPFTLETKVDSARTLTTLPPTPLRLIHSFMMVGMVGSLPSLTKFSAYEHFHLLSWVNSVKVRQ